MCQITGKKTQVGMNVSHSMRHTKRTFKANMQTLKFHSDMLCKDFTLTISINGLRTLMKHGGLDLYVMSKPNSRLTDDMLAVKKAILKKNGAVAKKVADESKVKKPNRSARLVKKVAAKGIAQ
ncbi:MAG: 50S ribosomal protein L28 [Rickettsiales bacterium]|jgi:large subunit ribosomal protein L28|nr:50S ribosomal protein L28 [Rickettsiales bacterium]